ncbi:MAG: DUF4395 domain-containing protein [Jatrophihabitans sp.]|nr:MAG: DUF4395 domain-containing protein [Jatrophihabitans sp.]
MAILGFPDPVNEKAARAVAGQVALAGVAVLVIAAAAGGAWLWLSALLAAGFLARVLTGPTLSPFGQVATRVIAPRLGPAKPVAGAPKRFAQGIGLAVTTAATALMASGHPAGTVVLLVLLVAAATLECVFAFCMGCQIFAVLMRLGVIPERICVECADVRLRAPAAAEAIARR